MNNDYITPISVIFGDCLNKNYRLLNAIIENTTEIPKLAKAIKLVKGYNNFSGKAVAEIVTLLHKKGLISSASFGRESSPVLYVRIPYWSNQQSKATKKDEENPVKYSETKRKKMIKDVILLMKGTKPDEIHTQKDFLFDGGIRFWWD